MPTTKGAPWKRDPPHKRTGRSSRKLTAGQKKRAKAAAAKAGRRYPNLVDNMRVASGQSKPKGRPARRKGSKKRAKDPQGGLTAHGRAQFRRSEGAHLRPGVRKPAAEMSPDDMRRKGSWAVRFYGRAGKLPPLVDASGEPTRFALSAAAWGEPVPRTAAAARKIAAKGRRLLARYKSARARPRGGPS